MKCSKRTKLPLFTKEEAYFSFGTITIFILVLIFSGSCFAFWLTRINYSRIETVSTTCTGEELNSPK
jgi:hypothetical protein